MTKPGEKNLITDVPGLTVGHATDARAQTGVTVLRCASAFVSAVDIRGGAPATRETDVLDTENLVARADAFVLSGGSVFGLAAADGVASALSAADVGLRLTPKNPAIPIVPAAALHDLGNDGDKDWDGAPPYARLGKDALAGADKIFALGPVGAGRGAMAGTMPGGIGSASVALEDGVIVGALAAVNPVGSVLMADGDTFYAWPWEMGDEFGGRKPPQQRDAPDPFPAHGRLGKRPTEARQATTLAIVATSADLSGVEAKRVAMMAHDGVARAVRPAHTIFDGDIVFSVATAATAFAPDDTVPRAVRVAAIGAAAADCLARAVARGVYHAKP